MTGHRILVADDNALNRDLVREVLEPLGYEIVEACDVAEGRVRLGEKPPDLVLLDVRMPGGGGEALLREIRDNAALADLPVVAFTAFAMHGDRERLLATGFDGYLAKPLDTLALGDQIAAFLGRRRAVDQGSSR